MIEQCIISPTDKVEVENINVPGKTYFVNAQKYNAMREVLLGRLPTKNPGLNQSEMIEQVIQYLPSNLFPAGATAGWWVKTVQLDLEAKGIVIRENSKPLRWHKTQQQKR